MRDTICKVNLFLLLFVGGAGVSHGVEDVVVEVHVEQHGHTEHHDVHEDDEAAGCQVLSHVVESATGLVT